MKEIVCGNKIVYKKNFFERFYTKLIGKNVTWLYVVFLFWAYCAVSFVFAAVTKSGFWVISVIVSTLICILAFAIPLNKVVFTFKPLPYFFGSKRKYERHIKNVISTTEKLLHKSEEEQIVRFWGYVKGKTTETSENTPSEKRRWWMPRLFRKK